MEVNIESVERLGHVIRATRKSYNIRLDDLAGMAGVSTSYAGDLERGKETAQIGKLFQILKELGLHLVVDVPSTTDLELLNAPVKRKSK